MSKSTFRKLDEGQKTAGSRAQDGANDNTTGAAPITIAEIKTLLSDCGGKPDTETLGALLERISLLENKRAVVKFIEIVLENVVGTDRKEKTRGFLLAAKKTLAAEEKQKARASMPHIDEAEQPDVPLPSWGEFWIKHNGRIFVGKMMEAKDGTVVPEPLHTALTLSAGLQYKDQLVQGTELTRGVLIEFENELGEIKNLQFTRGEVANRHESHKVIKELANAGVWFGPNGRDQLIRSLCGAGGTEMGSVYAYPGFRDGGYCYITPGGQVYGSNVPTRIYLEKPLPGYVQLGTFEQWFKGIAPCFSGVIFAKAPHAAASIIFAFVAPLVDRLEASESPFLSLAGKSSNFKTTSLRLASSVWGKTKAGDEGSLITFNSTIHKLEQNVHRRSGSLVAIDDTSQIEGKTKEDQDKLLVSFVYKGAGNSGRERMGADSFKWRIAGIISTETPIRDLVGATNSSAASGLMARVCEIVVENNYISAEDRAWVEPAFDNCGHAGSMFVEKLLADGWNREKIDFELKLRKARLNEGETIQQVERSSTALAYMWLAGDIAQEAGLIPVEFGIEGFIRNLWASSRDAVNTELAIPARIYGGLSVAFNAGELQIRDEKGGSVLGTGVGKCAGAVCAAEIYAEDENGTKRIHAAFVVPATTFAALIGPKENVSDAIKILAKNSAVILSEPGRNGRPLWRGGRAGIGGVPAYVLAAHAVLGVTEEGAREMIESQRRLMLHKQGGWSEVAPSDPEFAAAVKVRGVH